MGSYCDVGLLSFFLPVPVFLVMSYILVLKCWKFYPRAVENHHFFSTCILSCSVNFLVIPSFEKVKLPCSELGFFSDEINIIFHQNNYISESLAFNPYCQSCFLLLFRKSLSCSFSLYSVLMRSLTLSYFKLSLGLWMVKSP